MTAIDPQTQPQTERPPELSALLAPVRSVAGAGQKAEAALAKLLHIQPDAHPRLLDLLWRFPVGFSDRRARPLIAEAEPGRIATLRVTVRKHKPAPASTRAPYKVACEDESGVIDLVFFHADARFLERLLPVGEERYVSGAVERYGKRLQMSHPDHILTRAQFEAMPDLEPIYPLAAGLTQKQMRRFVSEALARVPDTPEWIDARLREAQGWPDMRSALDTLHRPIDDADMAGAETARRRLSYDELFAGQLALALLRREFRRGGGRSVIGDGALLKRMRAALPFQLTAGQEIALAEILADMAAPRRMLRLLQGDVGSGKTAVAMLAMARAVEAGHQAALMAPTEVLARQHHETLAPVFAACGVRVALLTGREKGRARAAVLASVASGDAGALIGTHALYQPEVAFRDLALAVIDEQHRFGVHQRFALQAKSGAAGCDVLLTTATPIPRTLLLSHFGEMDASKLKEKPAGRKPILTRAAPIERLEEVTAAVGRALKSGAQVYWVCPLIETSAKNEAAAAEERAAYLRQRFVGAVGLVHGRMKAADRDAAIEAFAAGRTGVLVATTVIEVGVNVPNATVMVIENAQSFGLAQLHQLRGRVGRGSAQSSCMLLYTGPLSETAKARLDVLRRTNDGFLIAEEDLRLRGGGEALGARQSGDPGFRVAQMPQDAGLLQTASDQVKYLLAKDPLLTSPAGCAAKLCLALFDRADAARLIDAG
ncbi:MAG: ATP-dependent DNA helicase RecG [Hyphomicrobiales bacterium]|nr:ATP-dependent DNA helicase RecG [Hyphomicrobiales bacterium]